MLYREAGDYSTSYPEDSQTFPIKFDRYRYYAILAVAFLVIPFFVNDYWANAVLVPFFGTAPGLSSVTKGGAATIDSGGRVRFHMSQGQLTYLPN